MRTTITLDKDVATALERIRKNRDGSLKQVVNETLRAGIKQLAIRPKQRQLFQTRSVSLGRCALSSVDNVAEALAIGERESFR